jgi:hypothetical protein
MSEYETCILILESYISRLNYEIFVMVLVIIFTFYFIYELVKKLRR